MSQEVDCEEDMPILHWDLDAVSAYFRHRG